MAPDFLLHLSNTSLALDYRSFADLKQWCRLGEIELNTPNVEASVLALRNLVKRPYIYPTDILIALPSNKIELLKIAQTGLTTDDIKAALTTHTKHSILELCFDHFESKNQTVIAYVTLKTLDEVKNLVQNFGFEPIHFVGLPGRVWQNNFAVFGEENSLFDASTFLLSSYSRPTDQDRPPELSIPSTLTATDLILEIENSIKKTKHAFNKAKTFLNIKAIKLIMANMFPPIGSGDPNAQLKTDLGGTKNKETEIETAINETKKWLGINTEKSWYEELSGGAKSQSYRAFFNSKILGEASSQNLSFVLVALIAVTFGLSILSLSTIYGRSTVNSWFYPTDLAMSNSTPNDKSSWNSNSHSKANTGNLNIQKLNTNNNQDSVSSQMQPANNTQLIAPALNHNKVGLINTSELKKTRVSRNLAIKRNIFSALTIDTAPLDYTKSVEKSFSITRDEILLPASLLLSQPHKKTKINKDFDEKNLILSQPVGVPNLATVPPNGMMKKQGLPTIEKRLLHFNELSKSIVRPQTRVAIKISMPDERPPLRKLSEITSKDYKHHSKSLVNQSKQNGPERQSINYTQNWLNSLSPPIRKDSEWTCLTEALYFEARGEKVVGQFAVAEVILNRVDSPKFPDTVCAVVDQGSGRKHACQFSYRCDGVHENIPKNNNFDRAGRIAEIMISGGSRQLVGGATFYHSTSVQPFWSLEFYETTKIGKHKFYTPNKGNTVVFLRPTLRPLTIQNKKNKPVKIDVSTISKSNRPKTRQNLPELATIPIEKIIKPSEFTPPSSVSSSYTKLAATIENLLDFDKVNLIGVSGTPKKRSALVRLLNGQIIKIGIGDNLNGGHVVEISTATLTYLKSGKSIILKLPKS